MKITCIVTPNSQKTQLRECNENNGEFVLRIALHATPEKGKANLELIAFLSDLLNIPKNQVNIASGHTIRKKIVNINLNDDEIKTKFSSFVRQEVMF